MGQNRKDGQSSPGRIVDFQRELESDFDIEKTIGKRQVYVMTILFILIIIREIYFPSHILLMEFFA